MTLAPVSSAARDLSCMMQLAGSVQPCQLIELVQDMRFLPNGGLASFCIETHRLCPVWASACFPPEHADSANFCSGVRHTCGGATAAGG